MGPGTGWGMGPCGAGRFWGRRRFTRKEELGVLENEEKALEEELKDLKEEIAKLKEKK
jgi:hypothetical protein